MLAMLARLDQPIAAIATAPGRGAVGIVRVSAKSVQTVIDAICGRPLKPREATYLPFRAADGGAEGKVAVSYTHLTLPTNREV